MTAEDLLSHFPKSILESQAYRDPPNDGSSFRTINGNDCWKMVLFYDCGELDYIEHFVGPSGNVIDFWSWPDNDDRTMFVNWNGDIAHVREVDLPGKSEAVDTLSELAGLRDELRQTKIRHAAELANWRWVCVASIVAMSLQIIATVHQWIAWSMR